jgi:oligopeptide transport system substrate-binding protein
VSNGPFILKEWRPNQKLVGEKSATYWNAASVRLAAVHLHAIDSPDTEERAFRTGQLHVTRDIPITRFRAYRAEKSPLLHLTPLLTINFINVNTARPALADVRVRRALSLALDRTAYAERVQAGAVAPAFALIPPGLAGYRTPAPLTEDRASAQLLLAEAGFPGGRGFPKFTLARPANATTEVYEAIQASWRTVLGIDVELVVAESRTHWSNLQLKQYDLAYGGWSADYPDPSTILDLFAQDSGWNFTGWTDPRYDALLADSSSDLNPATRLAKLQQCEALLLETLPVIPFNFPLRRVLLQPTVRHWTLNALDRPDYAATTLAP